MRKKKLWKQKCAMGLAVAVTATSVPTPALAGKTEVPVANEAQALEDKPEALKNVDVATSSDADQPDDQYDQEKSVPKATSSNAEENDGDGDLIDDVTLPEEPEKATASDAEQPEEEELLPVEQTQLQPAAQAEKKLNENATIDVWDDMTEDELKEELNSKVWGGDENDAPDTWYYQATGLLVNTVDWVKIEGETLKKKPNRIIVDVVYLSLLNTVKNNSVTSVKIGINATRKSVDYKWGSYVETSIDDGEYVTVTLKKHENVNVTYQNVGETQHGTLDGKTVAKYRNDFSFKINAEVGWIPEVSVEDASGNSVDVSVSKNEDQYVYTIAGDDVTEDLKIKISYQEDLANVEKITLNSQTRDNFTVKYGGSEVTEDQFNINKTNREISIKAKDGYFLASVNGNADLSEDDFSNDGWMTYTIPDGESTISVEALKAEFVTNADPWLAWETGDSADGDTAGKVLDAVIDWSKTLPGETVISKDQITVEYLMGTGNISGAKTYKELTYEIKGTDSYLFNGAHNFGDETEENVRITWNGSKRYPKMELECEKLPLRPDRSNKDVVTIKAENRDAIKIQYKGADVTDDELLLDKNNHKITISATEGYYLESVDGTMLGDSDFTADHVYEYTVPEDVTELSIVAKKMGFEVKQDPTLNWYDGRIDKNTDQETIEQIEQEIIEAIVDWTGTVPDESVIDKADLKVEYVASNLPETVLYSPYKSIN